MCERRAVAAERGAMDRYVAAYMAEHVGATFAGRVTSVTRFGLFVSLDGTRRRRADPDPLARPGVLPPRRGPPAPGRRAHRRDLRAGRPAAGQAGRGRRGDRRPAVRRRRGDRAGRAPRAAARPRQRPARQRPSARVVRSRMRGRLSGQTVAPTKAEVRARILSGCDIRSPPPVDFWTALRRGWRGRCPRCGEGALFGRFLKMRSHCPACGLALEPFRADDAPAYFTIFAVGHIVVPLVLVVERYGRAAAAVVPRPAVAALVGRAGACCCCRASRARSSRSCGRIGSRSAQALGRTVSTALLTMAGRR